MVRCRVALPRALERLVEMDQVGERHRREELQRPPALGEAVANVGVAVEEQLHGARGHEVLEHLEAQVLGARELGIDHVVEVEQVLGAEEALVASVPAMQAGGRRLDALAQ